VNDSGGGSRREIEGGVPPERAVRVLRIVGVSIAALYLAGALLPRHPDLDALFGAESFRTSLPAYAIATAAVLLLLFHPTVARRVADVAAHLSSRVPFPRVTVPIAAGLLFALVLTSQRLSGDGPTVLWSAAAGLIYPSNALTAYLHVGLAALPSVTPVVAVRLADALAGAVYVFAVLGIVRECFEDGPRRTALAALLLTAGSSALYFGTIEVYAPLAAGIGVYLLVGLRFLNGRGRWFWPPLVLGITFALHGSAGLLLPSLALLANEGRLRPFRVGRWLAWGLVFLIPVGLVFAALYVLTWEGRVPDNPAWKVGSFLGAMGQSPILPLLRTPANLTHRYALLDLEHTLGVLNLWFLATPVGLGLLVASVRRLRWSPRIAWVASATAFLAAYPIFWNVSYSLRRDWDLFSSLGAPLALLAGLVFLRSTGGRRVATATVVLCLYGFLPFVAANTGTLVDRARYAASIASSYRTVAEGLSGDERAELGRLSSVWSRRAARLDIHRGSLEEAHALASAGRGPEAERLLRAVLDDDPEHFGALLMLGSILDQNERRPEGRRYLERAVRLEPERFQGRFALSSSYAAEGRFDIAVPMLEKAVRYGTADTANVLGALAQLERYWRGPGRDPARADLMRRLADERRNL